MPRQIIHYCNKATVHIRRTTSVMQETNAMSVRRTVTWAFFRRDLCKIGSCVGRGFLLPSLFSLLYLPAGVPLAIALTLVDVSVVCMLSSKIENAQWAEKTTTTRCGIRETAATPNFMLWLFLNNRKSLWHVKICNDAKVVSWLLKEMTTTSSDFMKIPQGVVVVTFYSHDAMWDKFQPAEGPVSVSLVS